jgi:20S proteasome subunit beta 1
MLACADFPGLRPSSEPSWMPASLHDNQEVSTGTTLVALEFADGVVLAADSRTSMGTYVANRVTDKLTPVTSHIFACRSGSAADTQAVTDIIKYKLSFLEIERGEKAPVHTAAYLFKEICYDYRDQLSAGIIVGGWDKEKGGQVYSIPLGGMMVRQPATIGGSGSTYLYGFLDSKYREGMSKEETVDLALNCVTHAINRDGSSGGCCRYTI